MAKLVLGTVQFGLNYGVNNTKGKLNTSEVESILKSAWRGGVYELDSAQAYGDSEQVVGAAVAKNNENFLIHSKFSLENDNFKISDYINRSLIYLNVEKLGYFYFHKFSDFLLYKKRFDKLPLDENEIINHASLGLGVSLYSEEELAIAVECPYIKSIQLPFNIFDCSDEKKNLLEAAHKKGIKIYCRSVFLQGLFFMELDKLPEKLKKLKPALEKIHCLSRKNAISIMSLALGFVKKNDFIDGVLIGVDSHEHLIQNIEAWNRELSDDVFKELTSIEVEDRELLLPINWS